MNVELKPATAEIIPLIIDDIRREDTETVTDKGELIRELQNAVNISAHCFVGLVDGKVAVVWGVLIPTMTNGVGIVWALTTTLADEYPLIFARRSRMELEKIRAGFVELEGFVNTKYKRSIRWLKWLGFEIGPSMQYDGLSACKIRMKGSL